MKKKGQTVEDMIMKSHYLNALEIESRADEPLSDMEREAFLETIHELKGSTKDTDLRDLSNRHNKMAFGTKSTGRKHKRLSPKRGREEEKEDCENSDAAGPDGAGVRQPEEGLDKTKVKSEHLDSKRGPEALPGACAQQVRYDF